LPFIMDGIVQHEHLNKSGLSEQWLQAKLADDGITNLKQVFYCAPKSDDFYNLHVQMERSCFTETIRKANRKQT
jgi:uncharacterized membrane protein YcaP (DUF421 family)